MADYDFLDQSIVATASIQPFNNDSFYNPTLNNHNGFAADGTHYTNGVQDLAGSPPAPTFASWYLEAAGAFRGGSAVFPTFGLILLSKVSLVILDESTPVPNANQLTLWMQAVLADNYGLTNNFTDILGDGTGALQGFTPTGLSYADGIISVIYKPDDGNVDTLSPPVSSNSHMVVSFDFSTDQIYLDVAL